MQQIADWLTKLGMSEYVERFAENGIDVSVLPHLTDQDLKDIGVLLGHRRKMLAAIGELAGAAPAKPEPALEHEPQTQDTAERRQVTVMFSDLVGSTALSARMDPEDLREVISAYQKCVAETVQRFGGFVAKYMGDGVLVYFGYPQAHEDDAERAVRAGLELIQAVGGLKSSTPLQTRVGIATGLVVVGDLIGSGAAQEQAIVGETPNLAARLQGLAEANSVVIAESTRKLLGRLFELHDLGAKEVKGIAEPVRAWVALRASSVESRFEALRSATTPLVGRDEEIALLMRRWEHAKTGDGSVVLISGEPGIGKSRIAQTIVEQISAEPHTRLRYFCSPHHQDSALHPSITQLERAAGFRREDTPEQELNKLEAVLARGTNDLSEAVPLFADLLSIPTGDRYPALNLTPQKRKEKSLHTQLAQVEGLAARQPVLMVFEDVHWSDPTTRELLDLLIDRVPTLRVLMILTFRPEFAPPWVGRPHVTMINLNRLPPGRRVEMIAHVTGGKALPKEIADQIIDRTDGVPLFIEELTKNVLESGIVTDAGDSYAAAGPVTPLAIPTSLHASLLARLDRLTPTREIAQMGAALGRSFSHELISAIAHMPQPQLDAGLAQLVDAKLIYRRGTPPDAEYTFKHALVQDAAYGTLLRSRRQQLHARIAETLEKQFNEIAAAEPSLMAHHCAEAGLAEEAVRYWLKAGQQAVARSAMAEAVAQLQKGLDYVAVMPDGPSRLQLELDLRITLGPALTASRGYADARVGETYVRARAIAEQLNLPDYLLPVLYGQWLFHNNRAEIVLVRSIAEQLEKVGQQSRNPEMLFVGHFLHGIARYEHGDLDAARALLERALNLIVSDYAKFAALDVHAVLLAYLGVILNLLGYIDQSRLRIGEALRAARRSNHAPSLVFVSNMAFRVAWVAASPREGLQHAEEVVTLSKEHGFPHFLGHGTANWGWSLCALGQVKDGLALLTKGLSVIRATGTVLSVPFLLSLLADAHMRLGLPMEGLSCVAEAAQLIEVTGERREEAHLHRLRGDLLDATGDHMGGEQSYERALAISRRQGAKVFELRAATSLARLWRDQGKRNEARELLAPVYGWFTEGFDTRDLTEAKALLDELNA